MSNFARNKRADTDKAVIAANEEVLSKWFQSHPEISDGTAIRMALREEFGDTEAIHYPVTVEDIEYAFQTTRTHIPKHRVPTQAAQVAEENARRRALPMAELKQLARQERPVPQPDALPETYIPIGKKDPVELTAEVISRAGSRTGEISTADLKFLIRRYGTSEVNKRLGVKPTIQPGYVKFVSI